MILTDADELRLALAGVEASLIAEREHSERLQRECEERHNELRRELDEARAEVERLRGVQPELPPRPPDGEGLPRYGLRWNGPTEPVSVPIGDGHWTPWHLADAALRNVAERQREACAEAVKRFWGVGDHNVEVQACRATPLVTDAKACGGAT